jgi:hypothetical protein
MRDFRAILIELKLYLAGSSKNTRIYDKEVADALGILPINFGIN